MELNNTQLRLVNCRIHYNCENHFGQIKMLNDSYLLINNCEIICEGFNANALITNEKQCQAKIFIQNSVLENCMRFIDGSFDEIYMINCDLENCFDGIIIGGPWNKKTHVESCMIFENELAECILKDQLLPNKNIIIIIK